jgi:hypothetical protein
MEQRSEQIEVEEEDFLADAKVCSVWDPECEACQ